MGVLGHGEHLGNRILPRSVSLLLSPPFSPPSHLCLLPPSPFLPVTLWTSLGDPHCGKSFTINLEVLLSVLYRGRRLLATGRIRLKSRVRRLKPKTWEHQRTPDYREHLLIIDHPKASIPTLKPTTTQEQISSRARQTMQILQQCRNIALSVNIEAAQSHIKPTDQSQNSLLDTPLHSREKTSSSTHQNTDASFPNQETLTSQSSNLTHWEKPPQ